MPPGDAWAMTLTRRPFTADRVEALLDVCARRPASPFSPDLRRRLLTRLVSGPDGVIELVDGAETVALAVAVDAVDSVADCAVLDMLAGRADAALILDAAEPFVARGARRGLEVPLTAHIAHWRTTLEARGYRIAYTSYEMETAAIPPPRMPPLPGPEWRWVTAAAHHAEAYHRVVARAMGPVPGSFRASLDDFRRRLAEGTPEDLLLCGDTIAGFATVGAPLPAAPDMGHVHQIGRDPDFRRHGLGPILLARALHRLAALGARRFALDVTASNTAALDLYLRHGFAVVEKVPVYRKRLG